MAERGLTAIGGDVEGALGEVNVPCYVVDRDGVILWLNPAAVRVVGPVEGSSFLDIIAPADRRWARSVLQERPGPSGQAENAVDVVGPDGRRSRLELSSAPLRRGGHVIGMFGVAARVPRRAPATRQPHLTPPARGAPPPGRRRLN